MLHDKYVRHSKRRVTAEQASKATRKKWKRCGVRAGRQDELGAAGLEAATTVARTTGKRQIHFDANADTEEARGEAREAEGEAGGGAREDGQGVRRRA